MLLVKKLIPLVLLILTVSCKTYKNVENMQTITLSNAESDTLPPDFFYGIQAGDKIRLMDKSNRVYDIVFHSVSDGNVLGKLDLDPVKYRNLDVSEFSIPLKNIIQVRGIGSGKELEGLDNPDIFYSDLYKIKEGEKILVEMENGDLDYMYFKEFRNGNIYGQSWGSEKKNKNLPTREVEIPVAEVGKVKVYRLNAPATAAFVVGTSGAIIGILFLLYSLNPIYLN
jgi:hypothetical protein